MRASRYIDVESNESLARIVDEVVATQEPVYLRLAGVDIAVISPIPRWQPGEAREYTEEELAEFMATGGGRKGIVDTDALRKANRESREWSLRKGDLS
jgi:hypothetical protein